MRYKVFAQKNLFIVILLILLLSGIFLHGLTTSIEASVNQEITFQGKIVNKTTGTNLTAGTPPCVKVGPDTCDFKASIYSTSTGTTPLWSEILTDIELLDNNGIFNLSIGSYCITAQAGSWTSDGDQGGTKCIVNNGGVIWGEDPSLYLEIQFDKSDTLGQNTFSTPEIFSRKLFSTVPSSFSSTYSSKQVIELTNTSGVTLTAGTLVILDTSTNNSFTTTNVANNIRVIGTLVNSICLNGSICTIQTAGTITVNATTGITRGQYLYSSTTAGIVKGSSSANGSGLIGTALDNETGGNITMLINKSTASGGSNTSSGSLTTSDVVLFRPSIPQSSGDTNNPLIYLNEDGTGTGDLIQIQVGGIDKFVVDNTGDMSIAGGDITGANGVNINLGETSTTAVTINANILPSVNNTYDVGSSSLKWKDGYFGGQVHIGSGSLILTDNNIRDSNGDLVLRGQGDLKLQPGDNTSDYVYVSQTTESGSTLPGLFWAGVNGFTNDPGIRVNPLTGDLEFRDGDLANWTTFDSLGANGANGNAGTGSTLSSSGTIADGNYLELAHNLNTNDLIAKGWMYDTQTTTWKDINTGLISPKSRFGNGTDGSITISSTIDMNTTDSSASIDRNGIYADMIAYKVTPPTSTGASIITTDTPNGLAPNDKVLLINLQGTSPDSADVGNYEFLSIDTIVGNTVTFTTPVINSYDGLTASNQKVVIQRVPQYTSVNITTSSTMTASAWDGLTTTPTGVAGYHTGIVAFNATGNVTIEAGSKIVADNLGYRGGAIVSGASGNQGESSLGLGTVATIVNGSGGGGGGYVLNNVGGGGGGGYGTAGSSGWNNGVYEGTNSGIGGNKQGTLNLHKLFLGSGGGAGAYSLTSANGGNGGGIIYIAAHSLSNLGTISSNGSNGGDNSPTGRGGGGGGAGGSLLLPIDIANLGNNTVSANGGNGGVGTYNGNSNGGNGGMGRIRVEYKHSAVGIVSPDTAFVKLDNVDYVLEQINKNTIRLYNYSGSTQKLRLVITNGGSATTVGSTTNQVDFTVYGNIVLGGNTQANESMISSGVGNTAMYVYNTFIDSDTGAWRNNIPAQKSSWYMETKDHTSGTCNVSTDHRCGRSEFPSVVSIIATNSNIFIMDSTLDSMWMRFDLTSGFPIPNTIVNKIYAKDGLIYLATNNGIHIIDFINDKFTKYDTSGYSLGNNNIGSRNTTGSYTLNQDALKIISNTVYNLDITKDNNTIYIVAGTSLGTNVLDTSYKSHFSYVTVGGSTGTGTSSNHVAGYSPYDAFDLVNTGQWMSAPPNTGTGVLSYEFMAPTQVDRYTLQCGSVASYCPTAWTVEGSNDGTFTDNAGGAFILDTRTGVVSGAEIANTFDTTTPGSYKHIRWNISNTVVPNYPVNIRQVEMFEYQKVYDGVKFYGNTSSIQPVVLSSQLSTSNSANQLVDYAANTYYISATGDTTPIITYRMRSPTIATQYSITGYSLATYTNTSAVKDWIFQGSNDGMTWTDLDTRVGQTFANQYARNTYTFVNTTSFRYYRLRVTANNGNATNTTIGQFEINGPVITASSEYSTTTYSAQNAIFQSEQSTNYRWYASTGTNEWINYDFGSQNSPILTSFNIFTGPTSTYTPKDFIFQGSNTASPNPGRNHTDWTTLYTMTGAVLSINDTHSFSFQNTTGYRHYRLYVDSANGGGIIEVAGLTIEHERMYMYSDDGINAPEHNLNDGVKTTYSSGTKLVNKENSIYFDFEKDFGAGNAQVVTGMNMTLYNTTTVGPRDFVLYGSNDQITYTPIFTKVKEDTTTTDVYYQFYNTTSYRYYKIRVFSTDTISNHVSLGQWALLVGTPTDQVTFSKTNGLFIGDETSMKLLYFSNIAADTNPINIAPDMDVSYINTTSINQPPIFAKTSINYDNGILFYGSQDGLTQYTVDETNLTIQKDNYVSNSYVGDYNLLYELDNGTISGPAQINNIFDTSGNHNQPSAVHGSPSFIAGQVGDTALDFNNATDDYISIPDTRFPPFTNTFSIGAWIKIDSTDTSVYRGIMGTYKGPNDGWLLDLHNGAANNLRFHNGAADIISTYSLPTDIWVHVAVIANHGLYTFYVNGTKVDEISGTMPADGGDFYIGSWGESSPATTDFDGGIDDVFTTDKLLSNTDITNIMDRQYSWYHEGKQITSSTTSQITISGAGFTTNEFADQTIEIIGGTGVGQTRTISSNGANTIEITPNWATTPDVTSIIKIDKYAIPGIDKIKTAQISDGQYLIGTNDNADGGGFMSYDTTSGIYRLDHLRYFHGDAGKVDSNGNIWKTTYDNILDSGFLNNKLHIISDKHYWVESTNQTLSATVNKLKKNSLTVVDNTGTAKGNQVIRTGWLFIQGNDGATISKDINFGASFDSPPTVLVTTLGTSSVTPTSVTQCNGSYIQGAPYVQSITNQGFTLVNNRPYQFIYTVSYGSTVSAYKWLSTTYYCYNWIAIGTSKSAGADLAENYFTNDLSLESGDVIGIDYSHDISVVKTNTQYDKSAIGIVTTQPDITLGPADGTTPGVKTSITGNEVASGSGKIVPIGLAGRVPVKVSLENGPIHRGDFLTPASIPGYAMKATSPGITIGRALENFLGTESIINTDNSLSGIDKLIELGEININPDANTQIKEIYDNIDTSSGTMTLQTIDKINKLNPMSTLAGRKLGEYLSNRGKIMAFIQTGYYWGDNTTKTTPKNTPTKAITDNVANKTIDINKTHTNLDPTTISKVKLDNSTKLDITKYITPQPDDSNIGSFTLGRLILREDSNSINSVGDKLRFQSISDKPIEFFGGSILFDKFGDIVTLGSINADSLFVHQLFVDKTTGTATIQPGDTNIYIENPLVSDKSSIFITADKFINYKITDIQPGKGFHVELNNKLTDIVHIKYIFIN